MHSRVSTQLLTMMTLLVTVPSGSRCHREVEVGVGGVSLTQELHRHLSFDGNQEASMKIHRNYPSLRRWVPPDQPVSAPAFFSSPDNMSPCLVSGSSEGHTKPRSPTGSGLISAICGGQSRDTQQLQVIKQRLTSGSADVRLPFLSSSRVPIVSPDTHWF